MDETSEENRRDMTTELPFQMLPIYRLAGGIMVSAAVQEMLRRRPLSAPLDGQERRRRLRELRRGATPAAGGVLGRRAALEMDLRGFQWARRVRPADPPAADEES